METKTTAWDVRIKGLVQGIGFRPFVYRMALDNQIAGWVENNNEGVRIHAEGNAQTLSNFIRDIEQKAPKASGIQGIHTQNANPEFFDTFSIRKSHNLSEAITEVSPDIAVCEDCLNDLKTQTHRINYPFINCTHCGPRFSIIRELPYDRHLTTMAPFIMCETCRKEYEDVLDRRFHAQPVACLHCGPEYFTGNNLADIKSVTNIVPILVHAINSGQVVALKGMGGYHLVCDATNEMAVLSIRKRKQRESKPMAVMMQSLQDVGLFFDPNEAEKEALESWRRPIVLLKNKLSLAPSVSNGLNTTGVVLPYMPLHHLLFEQLTTKAILFTSGNLSDEPVTISDSEAFENLTKVADLVVGYNREIHNRADDSVVMVVNGKERFIRRSRGYVPSPVQLNMNVEGIFAAGAELVNTFAIGKGNQVIVSQHIGDLKNAETLSFYEESYSRFSGLFRFRPSLVACDSHPDYHSSQFARQIGIETNEIQHHHAHIASCMAEHGLDEKVIGIALDGTGFGDDGTIWGGEFMITDFLGYERKYFFDPIPLPGGDVVTEFPWRTAVSYLYKYFGPEILDSDLGFLENINPEAKSLVIQMLQKNINCPVSSGAGRLFDAVAALTGICLKTDFHAQAPMMLEAVIAEGCGGRYMYDVLDDRIVFHRMFHQIISDMKQKVSLAEISAKFHNTIVAIILTIARRLKQETGLNKVVLSGGTFQNRYLLTLSENMLQEQGFEVFSHLLVPSNDGGIALGQLAIAAKKRHFHQTETP